MINERAYIHPDAKLGNNVTVDQFATIEADVVIGDNCHIGPNAIIMNGSRIGNGCKIYPGALIGGDPQDLKYKGEPTTVEIGDNTVIREYATIHRGTADRMKTVIGKNCLIMAYVHIAHDAIVGDHCILANMAGLAGHVVVHDYVIMEGGGVSVQQFIEVGSHTFIGGASKVRKSIPPYIRVAREPLQYIGINSVGLKRRGFSDEVIKEIELIYKTIYVLNKNIGQGVEQVKKDFPDSPHKNLIVNFIENAPYGIVKGPN